MYESLLRESPSAAMKVAGIILNSNETSLNPMRQALQDGEPSTLDQKGQERRVWDPSTKVVTDKPSIVKAHMDAEGVLT